MAENSLSLFLAGENAVSKFSSKHSNDRRKWAGDQFVKEHRRVVIASAGAFAHSLAVIWCSCVSKQSIIASALTRLKPGDLAWSSWVRELSGSQVCVLVLTYSAHVRTISKRIDYCILQSWGIQPCFYWRLLRFDVGPRFPPGPNLNNTRKAHICDHWLIQSLSAELQPRSCTTANYSN